MPVPSLSRAAHLAFLLAAALTVPATAREIVVAGLFPNKAVLVVGDARPRTYSVGSTVAEGVRLVAVDGDSATIEIDGKREVLALGGHVSRAVPNRQQTTLEPDARGHYLVQGQINGASVQMLLDTGATLVALPAAEANRLGIDYRKGSPRQVSTANGLAPAFLVKLDRVKVGDIELHQVDALVQEQGLPIILLGMSFLNRTDMRREGQQMVLTRRF